MKTITPTLRPLLAAAAMAVAGLSAGQAQAASVNFAGVADFGPLAGALFDGNFSYTDPAPADGSVALDSFTLNFAGNLYTLLGADLPAVAWFAGGSFIGVDYTDTDTFSTAVTLTAGFFDLSEAFFTYQPAGADQGTGGFTSFTAVVPEPGSAALLLAGLGLLAAARRRQAAA